MLKIVKFSLVAQVTQGSRIIPVFKMFVLRFSNLTMLNIMQCVNATATASVGLAGKC